MNNPYPITSLFLLTLLAGGCSSAHHAETADNGAAAGPRAPQATMAPASSSAPAPHAASASPAPAMGKYTAIIDGKEVACPDIPMGDDATIQRILDEGKNRCQVMNHLQYLTSEIGPRLTGSSN